MKKSFLKSFLPILGLMVLCVVLAGCENFLQGSNAKDELKRYIDYANAPKITVKIRLDSSDYGTIYPPSVKVAKGDSFTVELIQNPATVFRYWTFTNPATGEELDSKYYTITDEKITEDSVEKTITRKMTVTINNLPPDMEIRPKCFLTTEKTPPEFKKLNIANTEQDAVAGTNLINISDNPDHNKFEYYATSANFQGNSSIVAANIQNHHVSSLWLDLEAYDANSGVNSLCIEEKLLRNKNGEILLGQTNYSTAYEDLSKEDPFTASRLFQYNFKVAEDGVVNITITLFDNSGNKLVKSFDVIKDTICEVTYKTKIFVSPDYPRPLKKEPEDDHFYDNYMNAKLEINTDAFYIIDMDGNVYRDSDLFLIVSDFNEIDGVGIGYIEPEVIDQYFNVRDPIKPYAKIEYKYEDEDDFTEFPISDISYNLYEEWVYSSDDKHYLLPDGHYYITSDDYKDLAFRATATDGAGNIHVEEFTIYKSGWISLMWLNTDGDKITCFWDDSFGVGCPIIEMCDENGNVLKRENGGEYSETLGSCESGTEFDVPYNFLENGKLKNGIYYCYLQRRAEKGDHYGTRGIRPYIFYHGVDAPETQDLSNCEFPDFTCEPTEVQLNTGVRTVNVSITQPFTPEPDITYMLLCMNNGTLPVSKVITDFNEIIPIELSTTDTIYYIFIVLINQNGEWKLSANYDLVLLNEDNYSPEIKYAIPLYSTILFPDRRIIFLEKDPSGNERYFDNVGLKKDENDSEHMTIKYFYSSVTDLIEKGIDWEDTKVVKQWKQPYSNQRLELPFDGSIGDYCYVLLEDDNGNTLEYRFDFTTAYVQIDTTDELNTLPVVTKVDGFPNIHWKQRVRYGYGISWNATNYYVSDGVWTLTNQSQDLYNSSNWLVSGYYEESLGSHLGEDKYNYKFVMDENGPIYDYSFKCDLESGERDSFIKTYIWHSKKKTGHGDIVSGSYMDVLIFYPNYTQNKEENPNPYECHSKYFIQGTNGLTVFTDQAYLIHTLYCSSNLGDVQAWLNGGIEVSLRQENKLISYQPPLDKIPDGSYYTTIIHYADGTMDMLPVLRK